MTQRFEEIASEIIRMQGELDRKIEARRKALDVNLAQGLIGLEHGVVAQQRVLRQTVFRFLAQSNFGKMVTAPVIYSLIVPLRLDARR